MHAPRPRGRLVAVLAALTAALVACSAGPIASPTLPSPNETLPPIELDGDWTWTKQETALELGVTHTQKSLDDSEPAEARQRGIDILSADSAIWQNHHLMGFGTDNPEPEPGAYDWSTLDRRMKLTEETGQRSMLTLCCAPDWMKGGEAGETDWDALEDEPTPEHFGDFARLAAEAVKRYPQVERVMVWNELKGFWDSDQDRWDYEGYTELYNQVYRAVKDVRPDVLVGGPYVVLISLDEGAEDTSTTVAGPWGAADQRTLDVVDYWLQNNVGADFLAVDTASNKRNQEGLNPLDGGRKFADMARWLQQRSDLPIWWAEYYPEVPAGEDDAPGSPANAAVNLAAIAAMAESGTAGALLWGPQADEDLGSPALWSDSTEEDGGRPLPLTQAWQFLVPRMAAGGVEIGRSPSRPNLLAFRADDGVVVVNLSAEQTEVAGNQLAPWQIAVGGRRS
ncbi:hypothetical protein [Pseudonocardia cypriaca]|uniref:Glycosyl hydrolase family 39 n=1 Tax=Pseudonocardia cypriaca TaxID=882449 RepID=A0A543GDW7_9PSEU|nr:hypothetical protein [Pseudonocardia cypriaca]TQM44270.1 hypothetical protein FB388_1633 [Pseudonocardia cypriaca]